MQGPDGKGVPGAQNHNSGFRGARDKHDKAPWRFTLSDEGCQAACGCGVELPGIQGG